MWIAEGVFLLGKIILNNRNFNYGYNYKQSKYIHDLFTVFTYLFDSASFLFA